MSWRPATPAFTFWSHQSKLRKWGKSILLRLSSQVWEKLLLTSQDHFKLEDVQGCQLGRETFWGRHYMTGWSNRAIPREFLINWIPMSGRWLTIKQVEYLLTSWFLYTSSSEVLTVYIFHRNSKMEFRGIRERNKRISRKTDTNEAPLNWLLKNNDFKTLFEEEIFYVLMVGFSTFGVPSSSQGQTERVTRTSLCLLSARNLLLMYCNLDVARTSLRQSPLRSKRYQAWRKLTVRVAKRGSTHFRVEQGARLLT